MDEAMDQCQRGEDGEADVDGSISMPTMKNLEAEFYSIKTFLEAHTNYVRFLDGIYKTSSCGAPSTAPFARGGRQPPSGLETEIADKMERNAFRKEKMGSCKIVVELAGRASDALMEVLAFAGGWLVDAADEATAAGEGTDAEEEAAARTEELEAIRSAFVPRAVFMLHDVLDKTAAWLEQVVYDTLGKFDDAGPDVLLALFGSFDDHASSRSEDDDAGSTTESSLIVTSRAAPGYWHKKALSLASTVANDGNGLHETFDDAEMERFLKRMAESYTKLNRCSNSQTLFDH